MSVPTHDKYNPAEIFDHIPHYHGDTVRLLFVAAATVWLVSLPFYPDLLPFDPAIQVLAGVAMVVLGALTNPYKSWIIALDALFAGIGVILVEVVAIYGFETGTLVAFFIRELIVILFLVALYLSLKTLRAMFMHQIGKERTFDGASD
jgi:hypothetical protein